jgi:hypothetical protein
MSEEAFNSLMKSMRISADLIRSKIGHIPNPSRHL